MRIKTLLLLVTAIFVSITTAAPVLAERIETETGKIDPLGCKILKTKDGYKRGFIWKEAGHWNGLGVAVTLKAFRGSYLQKTMSVYAASDLDLDGNYEFAGPVSTMKMKFDGTPCKGCENILRRPAFQEYRNSMKSLKRRYGSIALVVKKKSNPSVCYSWIVPDPTKRYD